MILRLEYAVWKALTLSGALNTACKNSHRANRVTVYSGNTTDMFWTTVDTAEYANWAAAFPTPIVDQSADEAYAKLIEAASGGMVNNNNSIIVNIADDDKDGCVPGVQMRYDYQSAKVDLNKYADGFTNVYQIAEASVFYQLIFQVNSDNIYMQVEIDGQTIFPGVHGFVLEDLQDLCLGNGGSGSGSGSGSGGGGATNPIGLYEYDDNKWLWKPPRPLCVTANLTVKMKASNSSDKRDYIKGIATRRSLA